MKKEKRKKKRKMRKQGALNRLWTWCYSPLLADRFDDQMYSISCEILREYSTQHEEHSYGVRFRFQGLDC